MLILFYTETPLLPMDFYHTILHFCSLVHRLLKQVDQLVALRVDLHLSVVDACG